MSETTQERVERVEILRCPDCGWQVLRENGVDGQRCEAVEIDAELDCGGACEVVSLVPAHLLDTAIEELRAARNKAHDLAFFAGTDWLPEAEADALEALHKDALRLEERLAATLTKLERGTGNDDREFAPLIKPLPDPAPQEAE